MTREPLHPTIIFLSDMCDTLLTLLGNAKIPVKNLHHKMGK